MTCACGQIATWRGRYPIINGRRRTISAMKFWCETCMNKAKADVPGTIAVEIDQEGK